MCVCVFARMYAWCVGRHKHTTVYASNMSAIPFQVVTRQHSAYAHTHTHTRARLHTHTARAHTHSPHIHTVRDLSKFYNTQHLHTHTHTYIYIYIHIHIHRANDTYELFFKVELAPFGTSTYFVEVCCCCCCLFVFLLLFVVVCSCCCCCCCLLLLLL